MTARTRPLAQQPTLDKHTKVQLLKHLATSFLASSPSSALFFAERLHALDPLAEPSAYALASTLNATGAPLEALWTLRQPVTFTPSQADSTTHAQEAGGAGPRAAGRWPQQSTSAGKLTRPAVECSVRCARLYGEACAATGRAKEGREALARVLQPGVPLVPADAPPADWLSTLSSDFPLAALPSADDPAAIELDLARLARKAGDAARAVVSFRRVLAAVPMCCEAIEGLCELGAPPDIEQLLPMPKRAAAANGAGQSQQQAAQQQQQVPPQTQQQQQQYLRTATNGTYPPPLGPSQTAAVNTIWGGAANGNAFGSSGGLFTPTDAASAGGGGAGFKPNGGGGLFGPGAGVNGKGKGKEVVGLFGAAAPGLRRTGSGRYAGGAQDVSMLGDLSGADESSFETSFYPSQPFSFAPSTTSIPPNRLNGNSGSLFTPPAASLPAATAPGVKRTRAGNIAPASSAAAAGDADETTSTRQPNGRRSVRGVPGGADSKSRSTSQNGTTGGPAPTRRSSRLSNATSAAMAPSRSQSSATGRSLTAISTNGTTTARDKKRSKAGAGPSVLSDSTSTVGSNDALSPVPSTSPGPASPPTSFSALGAGPAAPDAATLSARADAFDYVLSALRCFAKAEVAAFGYDGKGVIEALSGLPTEQSRTARALRVIGRAQFEAGEYEKAEKAFQMARQVAPCSVQSLDLLSTTLWHLRSPTALSFLAQELQTLSPSSAVAWIASGNVFSHLEDHAGALRCFKRAAQVDEGCVYAYVLAGHESVMMEEWEKALGFFREAVRRDTGGRCYNAWFGLGNVYLKTGKYTLADYHFRRALEINPTNVTLICCVGTVLEKLGRSREALEMYERACMLQPESALAKFKRVRLMLAFRQFHTAEPDLLSLRILAPSEPNVHYLLGKLYRQLGPARRAEMLQSFAIAQDLEPRMASVIREQIERPPDDAGMDGDDSRMSDIAA
ncbi:hypothetical protein JCM8097_003707 [Rhodosporidiobolus ruineniae]